MSIEAAVQERIDQLIPSLLKGMQQQVQKEKQEEMILLEKTLKDKYVMGTGIFLRISVLAVPHRPCYPVLAMHHMLLLLRLHPVQFI
jgi:hypothetical protein